jgi:hypothetical protein
VNELLEIEIEIVLPEEPDVPRAVEGLAQYLGLTPESLGMTSTLDRLVDTADMALLAKDHSMRVRQKLDNMYRGQEVRLTYKYPEREHERLMIRREKKVKLTDTDYDSVLAVLSNLVDGVAGHRLTSMLNISELAREANLGPRGEQLNISVDHCTYSIPGDDAKTAEEHVFELESHGVSEDLVLTAADWVVKEFGGREAKQAKYPRGLRLLGKL